MYDSSDAVNIRGDGVSGRYPVGGPVPPKQTTRGLTGVPGPCGCVGLGEQAGDDAAAGDVGVRRKGRRVCETQARREGEGGGAVRGRWARRDCRLPHLPRCSRNAMRSSRTGAEP